jgi:hydrogenase maturation protease
MSQGADRILLLGYGNPGRHDDGLGPELAARIESRRLAGVTVDSDMQLQLEDAARIAEHDVIVFADAAASGPAPFAFHRVEPRGEVSFSTHSVSPSALLALAGEHFQAEPDGWLLAIRGYAFDGFGEGLSEGAAANLDAAEAFLVERLEQPQWRTSP